MAHITLSITDELYSEMKRYPQIKWSEAARKGIIQQLLEMNSVVKGSEWLKNFSEAARKEIEELKRFSKEDWKKWNKGIKEKEWKRTKSLIQAF